MSKRAEVLASSKNETKKMTELKANLKIIKGFLALVEILDTLQDIKKVAYDATRSLYQAVSKGRDIETLGKLLEDFFGPPAVPAGKPMPKRMLFHPSIKYLDGIRKEQALFIKNTKNGFYYGALWPWLKVPTNITIHLGYCGNKMTGKDFEKMEKQVKTGILNKKIFDELSSDNGGQVYGISMGSFLKMAEMEKISCTLEVKTKGATGSLHLLNGGLIAAESGNLKNRAAAYEILSWPDTEIDLQEVHDKKKDKIKQPLVEILSEALKLRGKKKGSKAVSAVAAGVAPSTVAGDRYQALRQVQPAPKKRTLPIVLGTVLAILVIAAAIIFGMRLMKSMQIERDFRNLMAQVANTKNHEDKKVLLRYFIETHQESNFTQITRKKIRQLDAAEEEKEFKKVLNRVSQLPIDADFKSVANELYSQFLEKYPDTKYYNEIQDKMSGIPGLIDDVDFEMLEQNVNLDYGNRIEAYLGYLMRHPNGRHKKEVGALIKNMSEDYFALLMREIPRCDQKESWGECILLCNNFIDYFRNDSNTPEVEEMKAVMQDKEEVAELMIKVKSLGDRFVMSKKILTNYLEENPDSIQAEKIKETLAMIQQNLAMNREWEAILAYSQDANVHFDSRIQQLNHYILQNQSGPYTQKAKTIMAQLQQQKRVRYVQRIEVEQNRQLAVQEKERQRLGAEITRVVSQIQNTGGRFKTDGSSTFTDTRTGATWCLLDSASILNKCLNYRAAEKYVKGLKTGGYSDWRLPYGNELIEIYKTEPFFTGKSASWYWTAEVFVKGYHKKALVVTSENQIGYSRNKIDLNQCGAVRAVRP